MNKKVKWSVIGVTSATFLAFAGLVAGNSNGSSNVSQPTEVDQGNNLDNQFSANDDQDDRGFRGHGHDGGQQDSFSENVEWGDSNFDSDSAMNQDQ